MGLTCHGLCELPSLAKTAAGARGRTPRTLAYPHISLGQAARFGPGKTGAPNHMVLCQMSSSIGNKVESCSPWESGTQAGMRRLR